MKRDQKVCKLYNLKMNLRETCIPILGAHYMDRASPAFLKQSLQEHFAKIMCKHVFKLAKVKDFVKERFS